VLTKGASQELYSNSNDVTWLVAKRSVIPILE